MQGINLLATSKGTTAANWLTQLNSNGKKKTLFEVGRAAAACKRVQGDSQSNPAHVVLMSC